ncbi:MAG: thioredoxin-dependent thiol peroxidase [Ferruginibacter sp.]
MVKEGDKAPAFKTTDQNGNTVSLQQFKNKKVAIYFYPKDLTETCTVQACNLRDHYASLLKAGISILGVSADSATLHKKFEQKYSLPFPLLMDENHKIIEAFGVWGEKQLFGKKYMGLIRTTFLINEKGIIKKVITKPTSKAHAEEIINGFN